MIYSRPMKLTLKLLFCFLILVTTIGHAKKPEGSVHDYYSAAQSASASKDWQGVIKNCSVIAQNFEKSPFAPEAVFMLGVANFQIGEYERANTYFSSYLKQQTTTEDFEQAIRYKFEIAHRFQEGARLHLMGWKNMPKWLSAKDLAVEIYDEVIATLPRHELASEALYRKGKLHYELEDFKASIEAYQTLIRRFPKHTRAPDSYVGIAHVYLKQCEVEFKDPDFLDLARLNVKKFREDFPAEDRLESAQTMLLDMEERYAADLYETGQFFERTKKPKAAALYYHNIKSRYPDTKAAQNSEKRLQKLKIELP